MMAGSMRGNSSCAHAAFEHTRMWPARVAIVRAPHTPQRRALCEEGDARRAVRMQQVRGAVAYQVERRRIGARGCDPVGVLARLRAPLEVGTGKEVGSIVIHERALAAQAVAADSTPGNCAS